MLRGVINLVVVLVAVFTIQDIRNAECNIGCRKEGFDAGYCVPPPEKSKALKNAPQNYRCACLSLMEYRDVTGKSFNLHSRPDHKPGEGPSTYYILPPETTYDTE